MAQESNIDVISGSASCSLQSPAPIVTKYGSVTLHLIPHAYSQIQNKAV